MFDNKIYEFARYFKRIINIENTLKLSLAKAYYDVYQEESYNVLHKYFKYLETNREDYGFIFSNILKNKKPVKEKIIQALSELYFSDLIDILNNPIFYKNNQLSKIVLDKKIDKKEAPVFREHCRLIKELRNFVCHLNPSYKGHNKYFHALLYFENKVKAQLYPVRIENYPNFCRRPTIKDILDWMKENYLELLYITDKIFLELYDDIALLNGHFFESLPERWSILRQRYDLRSNKIKPVKKKRPLVKQEPGQMNIFNSGN